MAFLLDKNTGAPLDPASVDRRRKLADAYLQASQDTSPIQSPWQGAARLVDAVVGSMAYRKADADEAAGRAQASAGMAKLISALAGPGISTSSASDTDTSSPMDMRPDAAGGTANIDTSTAPAPSASTSGGYGDLSDILTLAQNPWLSDSQAGIVNSLLETELKSRQPKDPISLSPGATLYDQNTNRALFTAPSADSSKPSIIPPGATLFDPETKQVLFAAPPADSFQPLVSPEDRAKFGIPPSDTTPYEVNRGTNELRRIGSAGTSVTVSTPLETQYSKDLGSGLAKQMIDISTNAQKANQQIVTLDQMRALASSPTFYSGAGGDVTLNAKKLLAAIAGDPSIAQSGEDFRALSNKLVYDRLGSLGNQISNSDRTFIENMVPNINMTPAGINGLLDMYQRLAQRDLDTIDLANQYATAHGGQLDTGFQTYMGDWAKDHPLFSPDELKNMLNTTAPGTAPAAPATSPSGNAAPAPGAVIDGYRFNGGDPANQSNWTQVQ
jgi:hypothetical protein